MRARRLHCLPTLGALATSCFLLLGQTSAVSLTPDENLVLQKARAIAAVPVGDFTLLGSEDGTPDGGYRYQLAFLSYSLCSVISAAPELKSEGRALFVCLVQKMEHPAVRAYWNASGFDGDALERENVMYRGHLNLMYGLARQFFGETCFDSHFQALSARLAHDLSGERPICCEPDHLFLQCNSVALLSLYLHDRSFGTTYASLAPRVLAWARLRMPLAGTSLVREDFRPSTGQSSADRAGYANAWVIAFLSALPSLKADTEQMYHDWKTTFIDFHLPFKPGSHHLDKTFWTQEMFASGLQAATLGLMSAARGAPPGEELSVPQVLASEIAATTFGLLAARAEGDERLCRQLEPTVTLLDLSVGLAQEALPVAHRAHARELRAIALFARTFRGWGAVLK